MKSKNVATVCDILLKLNIVRFFSVARFYVNILRSCLQIFCDSYLSIFMNNWQDGRILAMFAKTLACTTIGRKYSI